MTDREADMYIMLRRLTSQAELINAEQHAGNPVPPAMWSDLYQLTNEAKAVLAKMRGKVEA